MHTGEFRDRGQLHQPALDIKDPGAGEVGTLGMFPFKHTCLVGVCIHNNTKIDTAPYMCSDTVVNASYMLSYLILE